VAQNWLDPRPQVGAQIAAYQGVVFSEEKVVIKSALADRAASPSPDAPLLPS
jgi:hypothetical protein